MVAITLAPVASLLGAVNVKDPAYAALGDGATDDRSAIQTAIDVCSLTGGGVVLLPPGVYVVSSALALPSKVGLVGAGIGATAIKLRNGSASGANIVQTQNFAALTGTANGDSAPVMFGLRDLTIDGNKASNALGGSGLKLYGAYYRLSNVVVRGCHGDGFYSEWDNGNTGLPPTAPGMEAYINNLCVDSCDGYGYRFLGPHDSMIYHGVVSQNARGVHNAGQSFGTLYDHVHSWGLGQDYAWYLDQRALVDGCHGEGASIAQCLILDRDTVVRGGWYYGINQADGVTPVYPNAKGIVIGDATHAPTGVHVDTDTRNATGGSFDITHDGGYSRIWGRGWQTSGIGVVGSGQASSSYSLQVQGGATSGLLVQAAS